MSKSPFDYNKNNYMQMNTYNHNIGNQRVPINPGYINSITNMITTGKEHHHRTTIKLIGIF